VIRFLDDVLVEATASSVWDKVEHALFDSFEGSGTNLVISGDAATTPIRPTTVTAALMSKTGGTFDVFEKAEWSAGLLLAKSKVMKPMVASPLR
jgi:hypothetical protein